MRPASELAVGILEAGTPELDSLEAAATIVAAGNLVTDTLAAVRHFVAPAAAKTAVPQDIRLRTGPQLPTERRAAVVACLVPAPS